MKDDGTGGLTGNFLPEDPDAVDALRLAEVLERVESGRAPDLDPTEDPALSHLLLTAMRVRSELGAITDERAFNSFHHRSRAAILHSLEPAPRVVPFYRRSRVMAPFAAAAAAAALAFAVLSPSLTPSGEPVDAMATNLTPRTTTEELDRLALAIADIQERAQSGQPVSAPLLRAVSEGTAHFANIIEQSPERMTKEAVTTYIQAAQNGQNVLKSVTVDQDAQGALVAAQRAAKDGVVVAGRFLNSAATETGTPAAAGTAGTTATATPSATPSATPTGTATGTGTPASTATPSATPTGSATPTATGGSATGTGTGTPAATETGTSTPAAGVTPTGEPSDIVR